MDRPQASAGARTLPRGVWVAYLRTGAALTAFRVLLLAWIEHRTVSHEMTETVYDLLWFLRPEILLGEYTRVGSIHFDSVTSHFFFWASVLTVGSFIIATPILLVGRLRERRPSDVSSEVLRR